MAGTKGKITRAKGGNRTTIHLSDVLGVWKDGDRLFFSMQKGEQDFIANVTPDDGLLYEVMLMMYRHGLALNP